MCRLLEGVSVPIPTFDPLSWILLNKLPIKASNPEPINEPVTSRLPSIFVLLSISVPAGNCEL